MAEEPEMPKLLSDLVAFINRWPPMGVWRRVRIAVTEEEMDSLREYFSCCDMTEMVWAVRGVPLVLEAEPTRPLLLLERLGND